jgi:hypothetical protein
VTGSGPAEPRVAGATGGCPGLRYVELNSHNAPRYCPGPQRAVLVIEPRVEHGPIPGLLRALGFFTGWSLTRHGEDWAFCVGPPSGSTYRHLATRRMLLDHLQDSVAHRCRNHQLWALKCSSDWPYLTRVARLVENSYCIVAVGTVLDYARVAGQYTGQVRQHVLVERLREFSRLVSFLDRNGYPALVYDAPSAQDHPDALLERLCSLLRLQPSEAQLASARSLLRTEPGGGLPGPRSTEGFVDHVDPRRVVGWARSRNCPEHPVELCLMLDGEVAAVARAALFRPDVRNAGWHRTGLCGYEFVLPDDRRIQVGQEVRVVDREHGQDLAKSGILFRPGIWSCLPYTSPVVRWSTRPSTRMRAIGQRITSLVKGSGLPG